MPTSKHTPGPWVLNGWSVMGQVSVRGQNASHPVWPIARMEDSALTEDRLANAHLIAAAPDLLAFAECSVALDLPAGEGLTVLKRHGFSYAGRHHISATDFVREMGKEAIKKATTGE